LFTFLTVFAGGIAFETVGARIQIWPLVFNVVAVLFVYFECPDVRSRQMPLSSSEADLNSPTGKTLEEVDALFAKDEAILSRLNHQTEEKPDVHEAEVAG
jgi:hypothetical protein